MAVTENPSPAPAVERKHKQAVSAVPAELTQYDEAKLIVVKGKVKQPTKPDDTERNLQVEKLSAAIAQCGDRISEIKGIKESRRSRGVDPEAAEHKKKKSLLKTEWNAVLKQKLLLRESFQWANTERGVVRDELRELRGKLPRGTKPETLEADIQQLEHKIEHDAALSTAELKKLHQQVGVLITARPAGLRLKALEEKLKTVDVNRAAAKARLNECDAVLEGVKEKEHAESAAMDALRKQQDVVDMPALDMEKEENWQMIQLLRAKLAEVREDFNAKWKEWTDQNKHYTAWKRHDGLRQFQERQLAREQREAERNGEELADAPSTPETFDSEVFTVDQLLTYLRKFNAAEDAVAKIEQKPVEVPQGLKPFTRKDEEDLSFFNPVAKKVKPGKSQPPPLEKKQEKAAAAPAPAPAADPKKKLRLNHSLDILKTFMALGVEVPLTAAEIPATVEKVEAKKQQLQDKRRKALQRPTLVQTLPANGDVNGHAEEEEEEEHAAVEEEEDEAQPTAPGVGVALAVDAATQLVTLQLKL